MPDRHMLVWIAGAHGAKVMTLGGHSSRRMGVDATQSRNDLPAKR